MDPYAQKDASIPQKLTVTAAELVLLLVSAWVLFGAGGPLLAGLFGWDLPAGIPTRRLVIFGFSVVILARMAFTMFVLMRRRMSWEEAASVPFAFGLYYVGFAVLVLPSAAPLGPWDYIAIALFVLGCWLNTGSELARDAFKRDSANRGKLYTGGLFALSMHINFFGDIVWITAYAIVARSLWAWAIPLLIFGFFAFYNVPALDRHLAARYGDQFNAYRRRTKRLIPFVW